MRLIDTDVLIDHFHGHTAALEYIATSLMSERITAISSVTLTELLGGMRAGEEAQTEQLLGLFVVLPVDEAIGRQAAAYLRQYRWSHRLESGDALIAATAFVHQGEVITRNTKHYPMRDIKVTVPYVRGAS